MDASAPLLIRSRKYHSSWLTNLRIIIPVALVTLFGAVVYLAAPFVKANGDIVKTGCIYCPADNIPYFTYPASLAIDPGGNIYVADPSSRVIKKLSSTGQPLGNLGTVGLGDGQFFNPSAVSTDLSGNIYAFDSYSYSGARIQKLSNAGSYIAGFGSYGSGDGQFSNVVDIAIDSSGNIYATDESSNRIQKFNSSGVYQSQVGEYGVGDGQFWSPSGIAIDSSGNLYVADRFNHRIQKFNSSGVYQSQFGSQGSGDGQLSSPSGIAIDSSGNLYVADSSNHRIQKFNSSGVYQSQFGSQGSGDGQFESPSYISIDSSGNFFVLDSSRVQKFNSSGNFIMKIGGEIGSYGQYTDGTGAPGELSWPRNVSFANDGTVFVTDGREDGGSRIQKFNNSTFVSDFANTQTGPYGYGNGELMYAHGTVHDSAGNVYVADTNSNRIQKFSSNGGYIAKWGLMVVTVILAQLMVSSVARLQQQLIARIMFTLLILITTVSRSLIVAVITLPRPAMYISKVAAYMLRVMTMAPMM